MEIIQLDEKITIEDYEAITFLKPAVEALRERAGDMAKSLGDRTIWMINSTAQGGGVAEMLPRLVSLGRDLGMDVRWGVMSTAIEAFFPLTKNIHNLIHDSGEMNLDAEQREIYEKVNRENAMILRQHLKPGDVLIVHDPQPMAMAGMLKEQIEDIHAIWRCHIGVEDNTGRTRHVWDFLRPYADGYDMAVFTAPEYIPDYFKDKSRIIHPAIDPLSHKNRDLEPVKLMGILCNSGLAVNHHPVVTPPFDTPARRLGADGNFGPASGPGEIGLMYRPIIAQVSRWDRLKGFAPLMEGFVELKRRVGHLSDEAGEDGRQRRRLGIVRLVMAGPDPASIQDDPEGVEVMDEIRNAYRQLSEKVREDVVVLALPMTSRKENALIVNAIQRVSSLVVQNSLQEGFGLTATEAMWKGKPLLGTSAVGLRQQIEDGDNGVLNHHPEDPVAIADHLEEMLRSPMERSRMGKVARRRVYDQFLVFNQVAEWVRAIHDQVSGAKPGE